jgi:hypothetical protein
MGLLSRFSAYPSDLIGLLSFSTAAIACAVATRRSAVRDPRTWYFLALMNCLFVIEIYFGSRYRITELGKTVLAKEQLYGKLHGWFQEIFIVAVIIVILSAVILFVWRILGTGARVAAILTMAVLVLFAVETISLHSIDAILYRPVGGVLLLGWVWAGSAVGIVVASCSR